MTRGKTRNIPYGINVPEPKIPVLNANIHNRFDIEVVDAITGEIKQKAFAENLILNQFWTSYLGQSWFQYIQYGTGTGTPVATRTSLFTYLGGAGATTSAVNFDESTGVFSAKRSIQLSESTAVGAVLTEIGIAGGSGSGSLLTHAMLKDMNGNQISITKTATDIINIYATVFVHFDPLGYLNGAIKFKHAGSKTYDVSSTGQYPTILYCLVGLSPLPANGGNSVYCLARFNSGKGSGFEWDSGYAPLVTYSISTAAKTITFTAARLAAGSANSGGFCKITCAGMEFNLSSDGWYPGSTITGEAVATGDGTTTDFDLDFPWAENATIYVNGVAQSSGVTIRSLPHSVSASNPCGGSELNVVDASGNKIYGPKPTSYMQSYVENYNQWTNNPVYCENPYYETIGISKIQWMYSAGTLYASNDLTNWVQVVSGGSTYTDISINPLYRNYRYWKKTGIPWAISEWTVSKAVHFDVAPASGAIITADYLSRSIAKDANHVFDFNFVLQLGEKVV